MTTAAREGSSRIVRHHQPPTGPQVHTLTPSRSVALGRVAGAKAKILDIEADATRVYATLFYETGPHASNGPGEVVVLDRHTLDVNTAIRGPVGWEPRKLALDSVNRRMYVVNYGQDSYSVSVRDLDTLQPVGAGEIVVGQVPVDVAADPHHGRAYVANPYQRRIHVIDGIAGQRLPDITPAEYAEHGPLAITFDETTDTVYTLVSGINPTGAPVERVVAFYATSINEGAPDMVQTITIPSYAGMQDITVEPFYNRAYVGNISGGSSPINAGAYVVSADTLNFDSSLEGHVDFKPGGRQADADRFRHHIAMAGETWLRVVDARTDALIAECDLGQSVWGVGVGPTDSRIYVGSSNAERGTLWEFEPDLAERVRPRAPLGASIGATASDERELQVFVVGEDQHAHFARWVDDGSDWTDWSELLGAQFPLGAPLAAVAPHRGHWRVAGVDSAGVLRTMAGQGRNPTTGWDALHDASVSFLPGTHVTIISHRPGEWVLFAVNVNGRVFSAGGGDDWWNSITLRGEGFVPGGALAANSRKADHWDLFVVHTDGQIYTAWWSDGTGIKPFAVVRHTDIALAPTTNLIVVGRTNKVLDLFALAADGQVIHNWWGAEGVGWHAWELFGGQAGERSSVAAVARSKDRLDVFLVGQDGQLHSRAWKNETDDWGPWFAIGTARAPRQGTPVAAVVRARDHLDVFWVVPDGSIHTAWWSPAQGIWSLGAGVDRRIPTSNRRVFDGEISDDDVATLKGRLVFDIWADGSYMVRGYMHDSGWDPYEYAVHATLYDVNNDTGIGTYQAGHVDGTGSEPVPWGTPDRSDFWADVGVSGIISSNYNRLATETPEIVFNYRNSGLGGFLEEIFDMLLGLVVEWVLTGGPGVALTLLGKALEELIDQTLPGHGQELAGLFIDKGIPFVANPYILVPGLIADVVVGEVTEAMLGLRKLEPHERDFARRVFGSSLDDVFDKIYLTKIERGGAYGGFTLPLKSGAIVLNIGKAAESPLEPHGNDTIGGAILIHELVHAWQVHYHWFVPWWVTYTLGEHINEGEGAYLYTYKERWDGMGNEEQAAVITDWYRLYSTDLESQAALDDWRFAYVRDHIRAGKL